MNCDDFFMWGQNNLKNKIGGKICKSVKFWGTKNQLNLIFII